MLAGRSKKSIQGTALLLLLLLPVFSYTLCVSDYGCATFENVGADCCLSGMISVPIENQTYDTFFPNDCGDCTDFLIDALRPANPALENVADFSIDAYDAYSPAYVIPAIATLPSPDSPLFVFIVSLESAASSPLRC